MKLPVIYFLIICCINNSFSQEKILSGVVIDSISNIPLSFVNISSSNTQNTRLTNSAGEFEIPTKEAKNICFTLMGYRTKCFPSSETMKQENVVKLSPLPYSLDTISIKAKEDPNSVLKKAISNIRNLYYDTSFFISGTYIENLIENNKAQRTIRAEINVYDNITKKPLHIKSIANEDFEIKKIQKSSDTLTSFPEFKKINHLQRLFLNDPVKYFQIPFDLRKLDEVSFFNDSSSNIQSTNSQVIDFIYNDIVGKITINLDDYSIVNLLLIDESKKEFVMPSEGKLKFKSEVYQIAFVHFNNKYLISHISYNWGMIKSVENEELNIHTEFNTTDILKSTNSDVNKVMVDKSKDLFLQN